MPPLTKLFYVSRRQKLPRLRHHLTGGRKLDSPDEEAEILLEAGLVRDWSMGRRLIKSSHKTPDALFWELSKRRKADWKKRLRNWISGLLVGGYTHDPHRSELYELSAERKGNEEKKDHR